MNDDLGLQGVALLIIPALLFGLVAQSIAWRSATHWMWLIGALAWFVGGLFASEVLFGAETTEENLQPLIDGLLWDEALIGGFVAGTVAVIVAWFATRHHVREPMPAR
jgi:fructose-specific phosphotransferase system IIC component